MTNYLEQSDFLEVVKVCKVSIIGDQIQVSLDVLGWKIENILEGYTLDEAKNYIRMMTDNILGFEGLPLVDWSQVDLDADANS